MEFLCGSGGALLSPDLMSSGLSWIEFGDYGYTTTCVTNWGWEVYQDHQPVWDHLKFGLHDIRKKNHNAVILTCITIAISFTIWGNDNYYMVVCILTVMRLMKIIKVRHLLGSLPKQTCSCRKEHFSSTTVPHYNADFAHLWQTR